MLERRDENRDRSRSPAWPEEVPAVKIAVTGKGGTGKTTVAGILSCCFRDDGYRVLAVDADPDANLASAIGIPPESASRIVPLAAQSDLVRERTGAEAGRFGQMFKLNPAVADIPDAYSLKHEGIKLLVLGAVRKGGGGCACPENVLLRNLLSEIMLKRDEVVIVDMEAGIEHLGRATCRAVDLMLITVEPGARSMGTARRIMGLAREIGVSSFGIIANKVADQAQADWIAGQLDGYRVIGTIPYSRIILDADIKQAGLAGSLDDNLKAVFDRIYETCVEIGRASGS
jgi:CO dehydrogenase maturation factor